MRRLPARRGPVKVWLDWALDLGIATFTTAAAVVLTNEVATRSGGRLPVPLAAVAALHGAALLFRRRHPLPVLAVLVLTAAVHVGVGFPAYMLGPAVLFALYSAGAGLKGRISGLAGAATIAAIAVLVAAGTAFPGFASTAFYCALAGAAWWLGNLVQRSRTAAEEHARRADELAATREELAKYAVSEERRRIARELHDVVAHAMTVIAMHAGAGRMVSDSDPSSAASSLATVERLSREALQEMRRLVGLLRAGAEDEGVAPMPGLADVHRLVAEVVSAGMAVDVETSGPLDRVPPGPSLAAYRIIQEALTNAVRHGGAARGELRVDVGDAELRIRVSNDGGRNGSTAGGAEGGMGMIGMRERVNLYNGELSAGPLPDGGYRVEARIPLNLVPR